ncbi:MAG TPA: hypothetical protein VEK76_11070 [Candidatus Binatia bacterium]|nr:hypothetical protein [Candidatus Binatia bacterium]
MATYGEAGSRQRGGEKPHGSPRRLTMGWRLAGPHRTPGVVDPAGGHRAGQRRRPQAGTGTDRATVLASAAPSGAAAADEAGVDFVRRAIQESFR